MLKRYLLSSMARFSFPGEDGTGGNEDPPNERDPVENAVGKFREPTDYERRLRTETATHRKARREAEKALADRTAEWTTREQALKTEAETAAAAKADARIIRSELKYHGTKLGLIDTDGLQFIDVTKLKLDDKGEVTGAEEALKALKEAKPYLFGEKTSSTNDGTKPPKPGDPAPKSAKEMSPEEYKAGRAAMLR